MILNIININKNIIFSHFFCIFLGLIIGLKIQEKDKKDEKDEKIKNKKDNYNHSMYTTVQNSLKGKYNFFNLRTGELFDSSSSIRIGITLMILGIEEIKTFNSLEIEFNQCTSHLLSLYLSLVSSGYIENINTNKKELSITCLLTLSLISNFEEIIQNWLKDKSIQKDYLLNIRTDNQGGSRTIC